MPLNRRYRGGGSGAELAYDAISNRAPGFSMDHILATMDDFVKTREEMKKANAEFNTKLADLDIKAQYYGLGTVRGNPATGQASLIPYGAGQKPAVSPATQAVLAMLKLQNPNAAAGDSSLSTDPDSTQAQMAAAISSLPPKMQGQVAGQVVAQGIKQNQERKDLSPEQVNSLVSLADAADQYEQVVSTQKEKKYKTGPLGVGHYGYQNLPGSDIVRAKTFSPEEASFFSGARSALNEYIKAQSGVQRGFKEFGYLSTAVPDPSQYTPEQFESVGRSTITRTRESLGKTLDTLEQAGYKNVPQVRQVLQNRFSDTASAEAAIRAGKIRKGDKIRIGGKTATVQ